MRNCALIVAGVVGVLLVGATGRAQAEAQEPEEVFAKEVAPGQTVAVVRQGVDVKRLGVLAKDMAGRGARTTAVRVELRPADGPPVVLALFWQADYPDFRTGFDVVDVVAGPGQLVMACTVADRLGLCRIALDPHGGEPQAWAWLSMGEGHLRPAVRSRWRPEHVELAVAMGEDGQWSARVTDRRASRPQAIRYQQDGGTWRFARVTTDADGGPATRPIPGP